MSDLDQQPNCEKRLLGSTSEDSLIASAVSGLAVPLFGVGLGPRESAVVNGWAVHDAAVVVVLARARIAVVVVSWVDVGEAVASAMGSLAARCSGVGLGP